MSTTSTSSFMSFILYTLQFVACGRFGLVWQGSYQGNVVALKHFRFKNHHEFTRERAVYAVPLMVHAGIVHFLGAGITVSGEPMLVMEFALHVSYSNVFFLRQKHLQISVAYFSMCNTLHLIWWHILILLISRFWYASWTVLTVQVVEVTEFEEQFYINGMFCIAYERCNVYVRNVHFIV